MDVFELSTLLRSDPFWHGNHGYRRLDLDPPLTLRATNDGFEVRTSVGASGGDRISRISVMRYAVAGDAIHRVEPIAMNAHDSVEEWLEMPHKEAADFTDEPAGSLTWAMFQDFTYENKPKDAVVALASVGAVRACKDKPAIFQAEVTSNIYEPNAKESKPGSSYFIQLRQVPNGYRIHTVTRTKDPACNSPDLMSASKTK